MGVITYGPVRTPVGSAIAAWTEGRLCALQFGTTANVLPALRRRFPGEALVRAKVTWSPKSPLALHGTPFERRVWSALRRIPAGQTRTYAEIAREIGSPRSTRAVGQACRANPVAIVVPCHRVVPAEGAPGNYTGGRWRKPRLLAIERNR